MEQPPIYVWWCGSSPWGDSKYDMSTSNVLEEEDFTEKFIFTIENGNVKQICHLFSRFPRLHNRHSSSQNVDLVVWHNAD